MRAQKNLEIKYRRVVVAGKQLLLQQRQTIHLAHARVQQLGWASDEN